MRALVTGGCGFIGSHLVRRLLRDGVDVTVLDDLSTGTLANIEGLDLRRIEASILDRDALRGALEGVEAVFHLAAKISVPESLLEPARCMDVNVVGTSMILEEALRAGAGTLVFASSAAVYGETADGVQHEGLPSNPTSPYGVSKRCGEQLCGLYDSERLRTACLRFFNAYGPRQDPNSAYASVVPAFASRARAGAPITVFGDGEQTRDFVLVTDLVDAIVHCARSPGARGIANVGTGRGVSVNRLAESVVRLSGSASPIEHRPERAGDVRHSRASVERLASWGWAAGYDLEAGLRATLPYYLP